VRRRTAPTWRLLKRHMQGQARVQIPPRQPLMEVCSR